MTCSDVERVLPDVIDGAGDDAEFQAHLKICPGCAELVSELKLISSEAHQLAETDEPPARLWVQISNQLRAEGIIRDLEAAPARPVLVPAPARRWHAAWWLAPVAVAILAAGSYQLARHQTAPAPQQTAQQSTSQQQTSQPQIAQSTANPPAPQPTASQPSPAPNQPQPDQSKPNQSQQNQSPQVARNQTPGPAATGAAPTAPSAGDTLQAEVSPPASEDDQRFLSEVSVGAPAARATYERQLQAVNAEIRETQEYIRRYPGDQDARQHLLEVYQQKTMLYQLALDRIQ